MSQGNDTDSLRTANEMILEQPRSDAPVTVVDVREGAAAPASGGIRGCLSAVWHAITPCIAVALLVGSEAARIAIDSKLANNASLTPEQKAAISSAVAVAIQRQGTTTEAAISKLVDNATLNIVLADAAKATAANIADASQKLLVVGSQELNDLIDAKLQVKLEHAGLSPDAAEKLTKTIKSSVATQKSITDIALEKIMNSTVTAFVAAQHFASDTAKNASTVALEMINIASVEGQHLIAQKLVGKFEHLGFSDVEASKLTQSINAALATQTALTVDIIDKIMNQQIGIFNAAKLYASNTAVTVASAAEAFIDISDEAVLVVLRGKLEGAFRDTDPVIGKIMVDSIMEMVAKDTNLTIAEFDKLIASHTATAVHVAEHAAASSVASVVVGDDHAGANGDYTDVAPLGDDLSV